MIYDPFGGIAYHWKDEQLNSNGFSAAILFTGQKFDGDSKLYYFKARYYDPVVGVFTQPDPANDGLNHYVYANANPIKYVDPTGMATNDPTIKDVMTDSNQAASVVAILSLADILSQGLMEYKGMSTSEKLSTIEQGGGLSPFPFVGDAVATLASVGQLALDPSLWNAVNVGFNVAATAIPGVAAGQLSLFSGAVNKTSDVFKLNNFGKRLEQSAQKTKFQIQGQSVYKITEKMKIGDLTLRKGDNFYLDKMHKDHFEVFSSNGRIKTILNLDGTENLSKLKAARKEGRTLDF